MMKQFVLAALAAFLLAGPADAATCFGAPADYVAQFGANYSEPRDFVSDQAWWLEGSGDPTASIDDAMRATHLHYEKCFPFMQTWDESTGQLTLHVKAQAHEYAGGQVKKVLGLGFLDGGVSVPFNPVWRPVSVNEIRYVTVHKPVSAIKRCGRLESRMHLEGISPNGGERHFSSTGHQSLVTCKAGRSNAADRSTVRINRGWYEGAGYSNFNWQDDFRGGAGFASSTEQAAPVVGDLKLKFSLSEGANKWRIGLNPDVHNGSFGSWTLNGSGTSATVTIPNAAIPSGPFKVLGIGCEKVGNSSANPAGGSNCGGSVLSFAGD